MKKRTKIRHPIELLDVIKTFFVGIFSFLAVAPLILIFAVSITDENSITRNGFRFIPEVFSLEAYRQIFATNPHPATAADFIGGSMLLNSYLVSIAVTTSGTLIAVCITFMAAYALNNRSLKIRNGLALYFYFTMLFAPGIVPVFLMTQRLGLINTFGALLVPYLLFSPFNLFLMRNYMRGVPEALMESAKLDGANDVQIAFRIFLPVCKPIIAVVALFHAINYWNDWFNAIMFVDNHSLYPLQFLLFRIQADIRALQMVQNITGIVGRSPMPAQGVQMATVIVTLGPILFLYPYLQKYFMKGLVIGSVKG